MGKGWIITEKKIDTLVSDIESLLVNGIDNTDDNGSIIDTFANNLAGVIKQRLIREKRTPTLRMSSIGSPCIKKLWLEYHGKEGEPLTSDIYNKFIYGDLIETYMIFLIELSGHKVEGLQDDQELFGIFGHRDLVCDGVLLDIKSCSSYSFEKFKNHLTVDQDIFGYIPQLLGYLEAGQNDPVITEKNKAAFLAVDKVTGSFCLDFHHRDPEFNWEEFYKNRKDQITNKENIPERAFQPKPDGYKNLKTGLFIENGNEYLTTNCSYCSQKFNCYDNIRTFIRSGKPVFFTKIEKEPKLFEITNRIYEELGSKE